MTRQQTRSWIAAVPPETLATPFAAVLLGTSVAEREYQARLGLFLLVLLAALVIHVAVNLARAELEAQQRAWRRPEVAMAWGGLFAFALTLVAAWAQEAMISPLAFCAALAMGCLGAVLFAYHGTTSRSGFVRWFLPGLLVAALEVPLLVVALSLGPPAALLPLLSALLAYFVARRILRRDAEPANTVRLTAALQLVFAFFWSAAVLLQP